jgi:hypothetical protein
MASGGNAKSHKTALLVSAGTMPLLSGCLANAPVPIDIHDSNSPFYSARAEWHPRTSPADNKQVEVRDGVEFQYIRTVGHGDQTLATGNVMSAGGNSVTGPQQISHRVEITYAHLAYSGTAYMEKYPAEVDAFMGLGAVDYRLRSNVTTAAPLTLQTSQTDYALTMGMGLRWRLMENTSAEGRIVLLTQNPFSYLLSTFGSGRQTDMIQGELALVYKPVKSMALRGGYSWMSLTPEKPAGSPLEFRVRGPLAGVTFLF